MHLDFSSHIVPSILVFALLALFLMSLDAIVASFFAIRSFFVNRSSLIL